MPGVTAGERGLEPLRRERGPPLLPGSRLEPGHQVSRHPAAVLHLDALGLSPLADLSGIQPARRAPASSAARPPGSRAGASLAGWFP